MMDSVVYMEKNSLHFVENAVYIGSEVAYFPRIILNLRKLKF